MHVRRGIFGTSEKPRLSVYRSLKHIYAQLIDDLDGGRVLACASTVDKELREKLTRTGNVDAARVVGALMAERAKKKGIEKAVFDRGPYRYHGRVKTLAEAATEGGLVVTKIAPPKKVDEPKKGGKPGKGKKQKKEKKK